MTARAIQIYAAMPERAATSADIEASRRTNVEAQTACATSSSGLLAGPNSALHAYYSGFGLAAALAPCYRYSSYDIARLLEAQRFDLPQAESGTAFVRPSGQLDAAPCAAGWPWLISGMKTILGAAARLVGVARPTHRGDESAVNGLGGQAAQDGDNLGLCAATFCDGDEARYHELYNLVLRAKR